MATSTNQGVFALDVHTLSKGELKDLHQVLRWLPKPTVRQLRGMLRAGWIKTTLYTLMTMGLLLGVGLIVPLLLLAVPGAAVSVQMWTRAQNARWDALLPAEHDAAVVVLAGAAVQGVPA